MRRVILWAGALLLVLELAAMTVAVREGLRLRRSTLTLRQDLQTGLHAFDGLSLSKPDLPRLARARSQFQAGATDAEDLLTVARRWRWLLAPAERQTAAALEVRQGMAALVAAHSASELAVSLLDTAPTLLGAASAQRSQLLAQLQAAQPQLVTALVASADTDRAIARVQGGRLLRIAQPALPLEASVLPIGQQALQAAILAPTVLGGDGPVSYLVVAQNPSDLRPTGGFMGSWGVITVRQGAIVSLDYRGYAQWEDVKDPRRGWPLQTAPVQRYLHHCCMPMQDANWYPDFPTTAAALEQFAQADQPAHLAGVFAFDTAVVQALLRLTGPVELTTPRQIVTADNFVDLATYYEGRGPTQPPPSAAGDKQFLVAVASALAQRLAHSSDLSWTALARAVQPLLTDKHVLLAFDNPDVADLIHAQGWDGAVNAPPGDYLLLDEMSMSDNKVDESVARTLSDQVQLRADGSADVSLQLTWHNNYPRPLEPDAGPGAGIPSTTAFRDFFRLYLPPGSALLGLDGVDDRWPVTTESGHVVVPGFVTIAQAGARTVAVRYHVPAALVWGAGGPAYALHLQLQPGTAAPEVHLRVVGPTGSLVADTTAAVSHDTAWQFAVAGAAVAPPPSAPPWNRGCVALELARGLLGPFSSQPVSVPDGCAATPGPS